MCNGKGKHKMNNDGLHYRSKCFRVISSILLMKLFSNQYGLVAVNSTIWILLNVKNPFTFNNRVAYMKRCKRPSMISQ